jgi:hypothetical protein
MINCNITVAPPTIATEATRAIEVVLVMAKVVAVLVVILTILTKIINGRCVVGLDTPCFIVGRGMIRTILALMNVAMNSYQLDPA